jgi:hypothetical protein
MTEVFVVDAQFRTVRHTVGSLVEDFTPGIYKVKWRVGGQTGEDHIVLAPGSPSVAHSLGSVTFDSPVPLRTTGKTHEYYEAAAVTESRQTHVHAGTGSSVFVFAQDWTDSRSRLPPSGRANPARGLTFRSAAGDIVADLAVASATNVAASMTDDPWAACNVDVAPGNYRLNLQLSNGDSLEMTVVAAPGWQTQVFLGQSPYGDGPDDHRADLPGASVLMAQHGRGFDPSDRSAHSARLVEMARLGLVNHRPVLSTDVRTMLRKKFDDPMLGIFGAHLLLLDQDPDLALLSTVVWNLRSLLGYSSPGFYHPDVEALALRVPGLANPNRQIFATPPMLRRSWTQVLNATLAEPWRVPADSLSSRIAGRIWGEQLWLNWLNPIEETDNGDLQDAVARMLRPRSIPTSAPAAEPFSGADFESTLSFTAFSSPPPRPIIAAHQDDDTIQRLIQALGLPRAQVERLIVEVAGQ